MGTKQQEMFLTQIDFTRNLQNFLFKIEKNFKENLVKLSRSKSFEIYFDFQNVLAPLWESCQIKN